uniref:Multiple C2 and transmembrane domain-containing protein 1 n=1 Tax=Hemiscolopendra marginata TaxID=943146 RepID=A0A646QG56_9MYRI
MQNHHRRCCHCLAGASVEVDIGNNHRPISRKLSKSTSDISTRHAMSSQEDSSQTTPSTTPTHRVTTVVRRRGIQLSGWWATLKKFAPQRLSRSRSKDAKQSTSKKKLAESRLSSSHPDVSRANSTDYAGDNSSDQDASRSRTPSLSPSPKHMLRSESPGYSDPSSRPGQQDALKQENIVKLKSHLEGSPGIKESKGKLNLCESFGKSDNLEVSVLRHRQALLRQHAFFEVMVHLREGSKLAAKDSCGTSDPYVKFKVGGRLLYKSKTINKNLNPEWDEHFTLPIEDVFQPIHVKVFDYDFGLQDDFMGSAYLDLTTLETNRPTDVLLTLTEPGKNDFMGEIHLTVTLIPRTQEEKEQYFHRNVRLADASRKLKSQIWSSVVTIALVEAKDLISSLEGGMSSPYVKFRLSNEKYKSKSAQKTVNPQWLEQFDLHMYDDQSKSLEIVVCDSKNRDEIMGRGVIDLSELEYEKTHRIWKNLDDRAGSIFLLLTISGTTSAETISDLTTYEPNPKEKETLRAKYAFSRSFQNLRDVGHLTVKVYKAQGLASADIGGKSDPFCVLELVNARLQTQTEYKTLSPQWQKIFTFNVKDIHSVLEVTVYDEDRDHKVEFLGKVTIPLLKIRNGEKRWYALKDKKLRGRAKGQILLEMDVEYNPIRAAIRTFNPREDKYMHMEQKFKRQVFIRNVMRVKAMIMTFVDIAKYVQSCFEWENRIRSVASFITFLLAIYYFELYMVPIVVLFIFVRYFIVLSVTGSRHYGEEEEEYASEDDDMDDDDKDKEEKKTLKERLQAIQEVTQSVQNAIGYIASLGESIKNTFNFTVPFLSWLAIICLVMIACVLYFLPLRYLIMIWGINKFTRKLRAPHSIPNNEVLDFLSRVPDDELLISTREFRPLTSSMEIERSRAKKKKTG